MIPDRTELPSKHPRTRLAGPYGHPFHPILVTVPIGAWVAALVFDVVALTVADDPRVFAEGAFWLIVIGIVGALVAAVFGMMDLMTIPDRTPAASTATLHVALNTVVVVVFSVDALVRQSQGRDDVSGLALGLSLLGLAVLGGSGWLGGKLSYHYGVRVADEATQATGYRR